jgi:hypothetical protein
MAQHNIFDNGIVAFETLDLNTEFVKLKNAEIEVFEEIIMKFVNKHKRFTILTLKLALEKLGVNSGLLSLVKDKNLEHLKFDGRYLGTIERPQMDRKHGFISIVAKAIFHEIIKIDFEKVKESLK